MRAFIHAFQGKPWNEECETAFNGFSRLGIECILFHKTDELRSMEKEDIVVGGMLIMEHILNQRGIKPTNYNYPTELEKFYGRKMWSSTVKQLKQYGLPLFIKPMEEKIVKGLVVQSWVDAEDYWKLDPDTIVLCSEVINIISEWRCFICYGQILGIQFYAGNHELLYDKSVIEEALNLYKDMPASCSLDFGVTNDGQTILIEMNDGFAIGCYGLSDILYARFLNARWSELNNIRDSLVFETCKDVVVE